MKKLLLMVLISCTAGIATAQNDSKQNAFLIKPLTGELVKQIEAQTAGGNISVESVTDAEARIEVFVQPSWWKKLSSLSKEEIQQKLDEFYDLNIAVVDNKLTAIAKSKNPNGNWKNSLSISFKIFTNKNVAAHLTTSGGNIDIKAISGEQKITTSGGNLTINNVKGKLKGVTSGGNIRVNESDNDIDLSTSGGDVEAGNCSGTIKLSTSGGSITLTNLNGNINAATSGGNVKANDIRGELAATTSGGSVNLFGMACDLSAGTSGGNIKVEIKEPGKFIKIKNSGGKIELEIPSGKGYNLDLAANKIKTGNLTNFNGKANEGELEGTLNGGGTQVTLRANSGKIILAFK
jgi:DUF4097 and DUF4098 domain-containing protein YvlB